MPECERYGAEQRGQGRHHNGTEPQQAGLIDRVIGRFALLPLRFKRKVDHHDGVFLHNADEQHNADDGDHS